MESGVSIEYNQFKPRHILRDHIECFWTITSVSTEPAFSHHRVFPDGCMDVIFDFGDSQRRTPAYVVGTMSRPILSTVNGGVDLLGVRFKPGVSQAFFRIYPKLSVNFQPGGGRSGRGWDKPA